jgi:hypothetical protein
MITVTIAADTPHWPGSATGVACSTSLHTLKVIFMEALIKNFSAIHMADVPEVGGKNASLGEMITALSAKGITCRVYVR